MKVKWTDLKIINDAGVTYEQMGIDTGISSGYLNSIARGLKVPSGDLNCTIISKYIEDNLEKAKRSLSAWGKPNAVQKKG